MFYSQIFCAEFEGSIDSKTLGMNRVTTVVGVPESAADKTMQLKATARLTAY
jgi:hypothetical protein